MELALYMDRLLGIKSFPWWTDTVFLEEHNMCVSEKSQHIALERWCMYQGIMFNLLPVSNASKFTDCTTYWLPKLSCAR
ncbi:unnamed protein product [Rhodiola kirilowii]